MSRLLRLQLTEFRNHRALTWRPAAPIAVLTGPNGSGKTNLLEAVSLLAPGRGLRGAARADLPRRGGDGLWAVAARLHHAGETIEIGTGIDPAGPPDRRVFRLDGAPARSSADIASRVAMVWLTPQMETLFQEGATGRRRFLDRLVWALEPGHAREIAAHDASVSGRNRLLAEGRREPAWLDAVEHAIARHAVAATAARLALIRRFNRAPPLGSFPQVRLSLLCPIASRLDEASALVVEDAVREELAAGRGRDAATRSTGCGAHRADLALSDAADGTPAALASTGQRKAMLTGLVLGHASLVGESRGVPPILLLDEPAVHLDDMRRRALFDALVGGSAQAILTGTDAEAFAPLRFHAEGLRVDAGSLAPDPGFSPAA